MDEPQIEQDSVRIPTSLNDEDAFFQLAELQLSLRQLLTIFSFAALWFMFAKILSDELGVMLGWSMALFSPLILAGFILAFVKRNEKGDGFSLFGSGVTIEEYLSDLLAYKIDAKNYSINEPRDIEETYANASIGEFSDLDDDDDFYTGGIY